MTKKLCLASPRRFPCLLAIALFLALLLAACDEGETDLPVSPDVQKAAATAVAEKDVSELKRLAPTAAYEATQAASKRAQATPEPTKETSPAPILPTVGKPTTPQSVDEPTPPPGATPIPPSATTPETDRQALAALYQATGGDHWTNNDGWISEKPLKEWYGVNTGGNGRATSLSLTNNNLIGPLPPELGNLVNLQTLSLSNNPELTGGIPEPFGNLAKLKTLHLHDTGMSGEAPASLRDLSNLESLQLPAPLCLPKDLSRLVPNTIGAEIDGWGHLYCREWEALAALYEATDGDNWKNNDNWLSRQPFSTWHGATWRSRTLILSFNNLKGALPPELGKLARVTGLHLNDNGLTGQVPSELGNLVNLQTLSLSNNPELTGGIPEPFGNLAKLKTLHLHDTGMSGEAPASLGDLSNLESLQLPAPLCLPKDLSRLVPNTIGAEIDGWGHLYCREWEALAALYEATDGDNWKNNDNWLSSQSFSTWHGATWRSRSLNLSFNNLKGTLPPELGDLTRVTQLILNDNGLTGQVSSELGNLVNLQTLSLSNNPELTGGIPEPFGDLSALRTLHLHDTGMSGEVPGSLGDLSNLESLQLPAPLCLPKDLSRLVPNTIGAEIDGWGHLYCREWEALAALYEATDGDNWKNNDNWLSSQPFSTWHGTTWRSRSLNLSFNNLKGTLPPELGDLTRVTQLVLNDNGLTGQVPSELGNLVNLQTLSLSNNPGLTGCVPASFQSRLTSVSLDEAQSCTEGTSPARVGQPDTGTPTTTSGTDPATPGTPTTKPGTDPGQPGTPTTPVTDPVTPGTPTTQPETDRPALVALYHATGGEEHWNVKWPVDSDPGDAPISGWWGVATGGDGLVTELDLTGNKLTGPVPAVELARLSGLKKVSLGENGLTGPIPAALGDLSGLEWLGLSDNGLTGSIPRGLARLAGLRHLFLSDNKLTGIIPVELGGLSALQTLYITGNPMYRNAVGNIVGCIPEGLKDVQRGDLEQFRNELNLNYCTHSLAHSDRAALMALYNAAGGRNWKAKLNWGSDRPIGDWHGVTIDADSRVTGLDLRDNNLSGIISWELGSLANLEVLDLSRNNLKSGIPKELGGLANLEALDLSHNALTRGIPPELGDLLELRVLLLKGNGLTVTIPAELGNLAKLEALDLGSNSIKGEIPAELGNLAKLRSMALQRNGLSGNVPAGLGNLAALKVLDLSENSLNGPIPARLGRLVKLESLRLNNNELTGRVPQELGSLSSLRKLDLAWNELTQPIPGTLGNLVNLRTMDLSGNDLTGSIPGGFGRLQNLEELYLVSNNLSEEIPVTLGNLRKLQFLGLSGNKLTGEIPSSLGQLANLEGLYLPVNKLTGEIPSSLGGLDKLVRLDLNHNNLSGDIPLGLARLTDLRILRIQANSPGFGNEACIPASLGPQLAHRGYAKSDLGGVPFCALPSPPEKPEEDPDDGSPSAETDRAALIAFYHATGGPTNWKVKWPVESDAPIAAWHGVVVDENGRVIQLFLYDNGLTGNLSEKLGNLDKLQLLELGDNNLTVVNYQQLVDFLLNVQSASWNVTGNNLVAAIIPRTSVNYLEVVTDQLDTVSEVLKANNPGGRGWRVAKGLSKASYLSDFTMHLEIINIAMNVEVGQHESNIRFALDALGATDLDVTDVCFSCSPAANCLTDPSKQVWEC